MNNSFSPSPYPSPPRGEGRCKEDKMKNDIGIDSCQNVVQHNSISSS
jgi:hypothetical protein